MDELGVRIESGQLRYDHKISWSLVAQSRFAGSREVFAVDQVHDVDELGILQRHGLAMQHIGRDLHVGPSVVRGHDGNCALDLS